MIGVGLGITRRPILSGKPASAVDRILGAGGRDYAVFEAVLASLQQDSAGTTPVTMTGQTVGRWAAQRRAPHVATQPIAGYRPALQSSGLKFDGLDDFLQTEWAVQTGASCIVAQVSVPTSLAGTQAIVGASDGTSTIHVGVASNGVARASLPDTGIVNGTTDLRGQDIILAASFGTGQVALFVDKTTEFSANGTYVIWPTGTAYRLATPSGTSAFFGGTIKRIAFGRVTLTLEQYLAIRNEWLRA